MRAGRRWLELNTFRGEVRREDGSLAGEPSRLYDSPNPLTPRNFYDVTSNGQRFMVVVQDETAATPLTLVNNWPTVVKNGR